MFYLCLLFQAAFGLEGSAWNHLSGSKESLENPKDLKDSQGCLCQIAFLRGWHLLGARIGGVWNGHFPESEKYFQRPKFAGESLKFRRNGQHQKGYPQNGYPRIGQISPIFGHFLQQFEEKSPEIALIMDAPSVDTLLVLAHRRAIFAKSQVPNFENSEPPKKCNSIPAALPCPQPFHTSTGLPPKVSRGC